MSVKVSEEREGSGLRAVRIGFDYDPWWAIEDLIRSVEIRGGSSRGLDQR